MRDLTNSTSSVTSCLDVDGGGGGGGVFTICSCWKHCFNSHISSRRLVSMELGNRLSPRRAASSASSRVFTFLPYTNCLRSGLRLSVYIWIRSSSAWSTVENSSSMSLVYWNTVSRGPCFLEWISYLLLLWLFLVSNFVNKAWQKMAKSCIFTASLLAQA